MSERILFIETSTARCSTALSEGGEIIARRYSETPRAHASLTAVFVQEMLDEAGWRAADCDAVCVGKGPGSYTGLRVGSSTAKGLCFGAGIPLVAVSTLETLFWQAVRDNLVTPECRYVVPMIDARRMEVYTAVFSPDGKQLTPTTARIVDADSFRAEREAGPVLFLGDGAAKCAETLAAPGASFVACEPDASAMLVPARAALREGRFEDVAYFEPFYLKEFMTTVSKKKLF
jgi:tRNA threonylcarbamoyladenosine biosynthesis protein TsaB